MKKTIVLSSLVAATWVVSTTSINAQTNDITGGISQTNDVQGQLSSRDFKFAREAAQGGRMEVTLGQAAAQNAQDPAVRDFGNKMVQDHQAANQELAQILSQKGASVSDAPSWLAGKMSGHLENLKGADFDKAYMKRMVSDHKDTVKLFQKEADSGEDADLKNFATKTLPTLQEHLRMALDTQAKLTSSASR